ncbi:amidohydrolase [Yunchengibacter salinarum]|uniref:amidohydrolase n=1 Tax=Yunchengibacter salinarum TaxID=3133399 RepID=UPI0035B5919A
MLNGISPMRRLVSGAALGLGMMAAPMLSGAVSAQNSDLTSAVQQDYGYLHDLYVHLHQNPELSYQEKDSMERVARELSDVGFDVTTGVGGHGLVGVLKNGDGPTVLVRSDLDALPVKEQTGLPFASDVTTTDDQGNTVPVMHACGHDLHMTTLVGTARRLAALRDQWSGTLVMIGQPAEERVTGAEAMLEDGLFENFPLPDYNLALHVSASLPSGKLGLTEGYALANVDSVDVHFFGEGGHGAYPHTTKDPVIMASQTVVALQTLVSREISPLDPGVVTVGSIHAGTKHNIISDEAHLQLTVRSYKDSVRNQLVSGIERIARAQAMSVGMPEEKWPDVSVSESTPSTYNDPALTRRIKTGFEETFGAERVEMVPPVMAAEDFALYGRTSHDIPSLIFWLGGASPEAVAKAEESGNALPSLHSPFFAPDVEIALPQGVRAMTTAVLDLMKENTQ